MIRYAGILAIALVAGAANAETNHADWASRSENGHCWAMSGPSSSEGGIAGRSGPYVSIQNVPSEDVRGSIAFVSGTELTAEGEAKVQVDGQSFEVLPFKDAAFAGSGKPEAALVGAMRRGHELVVTWMAKDGSTATDRYSLAGFGAAKATVDACK
jgi:hypothetical protein